ncbi:hypothetical protein [Hymenobacter volaticus]|uniref:Peptidase C39-like domain-containing protein n=1 Tax=Hymenobacter volaticus TaxID=2932254 RepID=A0ABY4GE97_9BACT|nr:hypothetical protein [Hymenobacter volaticus]UOQ69246.1 hypothetical protein MUN86_27725 [Hymenobacter volaticus]
MLEVRLFNPGLVENSLTAEHCVHACFQMLLRTRPGYQVFSFKKLDELMHKVPGKYTFEYNLVAEMPSLGFATEIIWEFDLFRLSNDPKEFFLDIYGKPIGEITIANSDLELLKLDAKRLYESTQVKITTRSATFEDIKLKILEGYYILCTINQRVLQADSGYVAHTILVYGFNDRGLIIHNPGPPSNDSAEIPWDLFNKAWACPDDKSRNIMAFKYNGNK